MYAISTSGKQSQEDQEFNIILNNTVSVRPAGPYETLSQKINLIRVSQRTLEAIPLTEAAHALPATDFLLTYVESLPRWSERSV